MNGPESKFNDRIKRRIKRIWMAADRPLWERVENSADLGTFDVFTGGNGHGPGGWVELKVCGPMAAPQMRPGQPAFGARMLGAGIPAHVLCFDGKTGLKLIKGSTVGQDWRDLLVGRFSLNSDDDWREIFKICATAHFTEKDTR